MSVGNKKQVLGILSARLTKGAGFYMFFFNLLTYLPLF